MTSCLDSKKIGCLFNISKEAEIKQNKQEVSRTVILPPMASVLWSYYKQFWGSDCGSVGSAVASNSRSPQFKSSHLQKFILNIYCQLY